MKRRPPKNLRLDSNAPNVTGACDGRGGAYSLLIETNPPPCFRNDYQMQPEASIVLLQEEEQVHT